MNFYFRIEKKERSSKEKRATYVILIERILTVSKRSPKKEIIMFTTYLVLSTFSNVKKVYLFASLFVEY